LDRAQQKDRATARSFLSVDPTCHNPNTLLPATPLITGRTIQLPGHHAKVRRDGCRDAGMIDGRRPD
jgi:hypothetical protein